MPYGRDQLTPVARDLASRGFAVWNLEYRRLGAPSGGWPETFHDVAAGIDYLATLAAAGVELDLARVVVAGHSAGGQLALWSSARDKDRKLLRGPATVQPMAAAGLAAVLDLASACESRAGNEAVPELLEGTPTQQPARYAASSPAELSPLGVNQLIVHGALDEAVPVAMARAYVRAGRVAGDNIEFAELAQGGHMDYLEPRSEAHQTLCRWLERLTRRGSTLHASATDSAG
jgi:acetyl esterase/lipase